MYNNIPVKISFLCNETAFGSFEDLTSKDGVKHIIEKGYRHYLVCSAPRIVFESFDAVNEKVTVKIQRGLFSFEIISVKIQKIVIKEGGSFEVKNINGDNYPEVEVTLEDGSKYPPFRSCFEFLCSFILPEENNPLLHEVLYVGQTEPHDKYIRLKGHETFAKIANHYLKSKPHSEIFIKLLKFSEPKYDSANSDVKVNERWRADVANEIGKIPADQMTTLIEAALIRAYNPKFNNHYKNSFPSKNHEKYYYFYKAPIEVVEVIIDERLRNYILMLNGNQLNWLILEESFV